MLALQFLSQNFHFTLSLLAALVFFAVFWLYFDAWLVRKKKVNIIRWVSFLLLSISFLLHSMEVEQSLFGGTIFSDKVVVPAIVMRSLGYLLLIVGLLNEPLQEIPKVVGLQETVTEPVVEKTTKKSPKHTKTSPVIITTGASLASIGKFFLPVGSFIVAGLYWRRATTGLERHVRAPAIGFAILGLHETIGLSALWQTTTNPRLYQLVAPFGPVWYVEHLLLLAAVLVLGKWVWYYLTTRIFSQLFMTFITSTIVVFLLSTASFSLLLLKNIQNDALGSLKTASNVLNYAVDSRKSESLALAESIAGNSDVIAAITSRNHEVLNAKTAELLETKKQSSILITDDNGQVLIRAEDADRWGDSLSEDPVIKEALSGKANSNFATREDILAPQIMILTASPVYNREGKVIGAVRVGLAADNSFLDGVKNATGLDSAVYAEDVRSATTFIAPDGKSRLVGIKEINSKVKDQVLVNGQVFSAATVVLNRPILGVYYPLKDTRNEVIGMLFVGKPQSSLLQTAGRSIELTFLLAPTLILLSIWPNYLLARKISREVT